MSRILFFTAGVAAIVASYVAVLVGLDPAESLGSGTVASIALPALVSGLVVTAFMAIAAKSARDAAGQMHELHTQIARKEVELARLASHDELTGLYSRTHFDETLRIECERAKRHRQAFALLLVHVDDLEGSADQAGSISRGYLLSEVAALVQAMLRVNDIGGRYADDTVAVLLPETDTDGAKVLAARLRTQLSKREFFGRGRSSASTLTVSQGIACFPCVGISSLQDLQTACEAALVEAKSHGGVRAYAPDHLPEAGEPGPRALAG